MTTLAAAPDLDRLLDDDTERVCQLTTFQPDTGRREQCRRIAAWIVHIRVVCGHDTATTAFVCDPCLQDVLGGPSFFACAEDWCVLAAYITHVEPLR